MQCQKKNKSQPFRKIGALQHEHHEDLPSIFNDLDDSIKNHFEYIVEDFFTSCQIKDVKYKELNHNFAQVIYLSRCGIGIDKELIEKFSRQKKIILSLESIECKWSEFIEQSSKTDSYTFYKKLENDFVSGGFLNTSSVFYVNCQYIEGNTRFLDWLVKSNDQKKFNRNYCMKIKLDEFLIKYPQHLLAVVGYNHLFNNKGILTLYEQQG